MDNVDALKSELAALVEDAADVQALEQVRVSALGKKGQITALMKGLGQMEPDERKAAGQQLNVLKQEIAELIDARKFELENAGLDTRLAKEKIDVTLPVRPEQMGTIHPISQTHPLQQIRCPLLPHATSGAIVDQGQFNITQCRGVSEQIETLEYEPDAFISHAGQLIATQSVDPFAAEAVLT